MRSRLWYNESMNYKLYDEKNFYMEEQSGEALKGMDVFLELLEPKREQQKLEPRQPEDRGSVCHAFYCQEGCCVIAFSDQACMVKEGQQLVLSYDARESVRIGVTGEGTLLHARILYDAPGSAKDGSKGGSMEEESAVRQDSQGGNPRQDVGEKGTLEDFKECMKLSLTNFRGSRWLFPYLKRIWYDESLKAGIRKVERFYLPVLLWFAGIAGIGMYGGPLWEPMRVLYLLLIWTGLVLFLLSPIMYFFAVPKPVKAHIRQVSELTEAELEERRREQEENPIADRILKKYKITGRNVYAEDDRPKRRNKQPRP